MPEATLEGVTVIRVMEAWVTIGRWLLRTTFRLVLWVALLWMADRLQVELVNDPVPSLERSKRGIQSSSGPIVRRREAFAPR